MELSAAVDVLLSKAGDELSDEEKDAIHCVLTSAFRSWERIAKALEGIQVSVEGRS